MKRNYHVRSILLAIVGGCACSGALTHGEDSTPDSAARSWCTPSYLSVYDIATRDDLRLSRHIRPLVSGDLVEDWPILEDVEDAVGDWVTKFVSAPQIANTITQAMPTEGQDAIESINQIVRDCCKILHVRSPKVYVRNHPFPQAYVTQAGKSYFLVLTSGLLNLYDGEPEELRFVIGHELGHLKCRHLQTKRACYGLLSAVRGVNLAIVPTDYQAVFPTLGLGRLFSWARESEISADRAGMLCCQDPQVAYDALLRLLSGIRAKSSWIDPNASSFDAEEVIKQFRAWENEPFVDFVTYIQGQATDCPCIPERLAALKLWCETGAYQSILGRTEDDQASDQIVVIKSIAIWDVAPTGEDADLYVNVFDGGRKLFNTKTADNRRSVRWINIQKSLGCRNGQPVFFEVMDENWTADNLIGGFVIYPVNPEYDRQRGNTKYTASIVWDWKKRTGVTRSGRSEVEVEFRQRAK